MRSPARRRGDIQGLRGVAVSLVLGFHLWPSTLRSGFIGVDVFFVISGYLITRHLCGDLKATGRINVLAFWERRVRRLLPSALLVLASCSLLTFALVPTLLWRQYFREVLASTLYVQNWQLASDSIDYFAANNAPSPVQHFWTLSIEEQFYACWPLVLLGGQMMTRRVFTALPSFLLASTGTVCLISLAHALLATWDDSPTYFSTPARAWEFGAGAAMSMLSTSNSYQLARQLFAWLGVVGIGLAAFQLHPTAIPSAIAPQVLVAVGGTLAILWGGDTATASGSTRLLSWRPIQIIGDLSYSIYLWHWPLIVLLPFALGRELRDLDKASILVASIVLAAGTTAWLEHPIRFPRSPRRGLLFGGTAAASLLVVAMCVIGGQLVTDRELTSAAAAARILAQAPPCFGAAAGPVRGPCENDDLIGALIPDPDLAPHDEGNRDECWARSGEVDVDMCQLGPRVGYRKRLAAIGDSHSNALLPAYEVIAHWMHWRIDVAGKFGCYWTTAVQQQRTRARVRECERWKANLNQRLANDQPYDAIIVTHGVSRMQPAATSEDRNVIIVRGLLEAWGSQTQRGTRIIAIRDNPIATADTPACVARHRLKANEHCALDRDTALAHFDGNVRASQLMPGAVLVDLTDYYCTADTCFTVIGHVPVYRDADHITATFARSLAPFLLLGVKEALAN